MDEIKKRWCYTRIICYLFWLLLFLVLLKVVFRSDEYKCLLLAELLLQLFENCRRLLVRRVEVEWLLQKRKFAFCWIENLKNE
jgi:hypothetical protein